MSKIRKVFSESVKQYAISRLESGEVSLSEVAREVGATKNTVWKWSRDYGRFKEHAQVVEVVMSTKQDEIDELKKALAESHLKNVFYEELIKQAGKHYKTDLKKTFGTSRSDTSKGKGGASKSSARRRE